MKKLIRRLITASAVLLSIFPVLAAELGDPAPALQIAEWVKGKPVDLASGKGKTIYVVEFWATWCPPCRASIPHLTELQKKYKDKGVVFVGISDEKTGTVKTFVEKMGDKMDYNVAIDKDQKTSEGYMKAYGINGIPHAFIVDKAGNIIWNGHPMGDLEKTLEEVIAGKFDMAVAKKRGEAQKMLEEFYELAASGKDDAKLDKLGKDLEALDKELKGITPGKTFDAAEVRKSAQFGSAMRDYQRAVTQGKDADQIEALAKKAEALAPKGFSFSEFKENFDMQRLFQDYFKAVTSSGDADKTAELTKKLQKLEVKNPQMANDIAWAILTDQRIKNRDLPLALKFAKNAFTASEGKDAAILDTYARALYDNKQVDEAVKYQKQAVELCNDKDQKSELAATLNKYQNKGDAK